MLTGITHFRHKMQRNIKKHFTFDKFLPKILQFMRKRGKILYSWIGY